MLEQCVSERYSNKRRLVFSRVQLTLSSLHDERDTFPSGVVDVQDHRSEGRALGSLGNRVVIEVSRLVASSGVLAEKDLLLLDGWDGSEDFDLIVSSECLVCLAYLFVTDVLGRERDWSLHGQD